MSGNRVAAAFVLPAGPETIQELLAAAGAVDIADSPTGSTDLITCTWAGLPTDGYLSERGELRMLVIFIPESLFYEMMPEGTALLDAFNAACRGLEPPAAFIATRPQQAHASELWRLYGAETEVDPERLARERLGLLYISNSIWMDLGFSWFTSDRDAVTNDTGMLVWSSVGDKRWW